MIIYSILNKTYFREKHFCPILYLYTCTFLYHCAMAKESPTPFLTFSFYFLSSVILSIDSGFWKGKITKRQQRNIWIGYHPPNSENTQDVSTTACVYVILLWFHNWRSLMGKHCVLGGYHLICFFVTFKLTNLRSFRIFN